MKKKILFLWALLMGFFVPTHAQTWTWVGETPTAGVGFYLYNVGAEKFLDMNNGAPINATGEPLLFTLTEGLSGTDLQYTQNGNTYYIYQSAGTYGYCQNNNATVQTGASNVTMKSYGDSYRWKITNYNNGYQIHSNHKYESYLDWFQTKYRHNSDTERYIRYTGSAYDCSKNNNEYNTNNGTFLFVTQSQLNAYKTYFNAYQSAYNEVRSIYPDYAIPTDLKSAGFNDVVNKIGKLNELKNNYKGTFANPIIAQDAADPAVILAEDGFYYMYCSEAYSGQGIPVWRSSDMINWTRITTIFAERPANVTYTFLWAPEIAYVNGKYVLYYANAEYGTQASTQICVATSDNPWGPFTNNKILVRAHDSNFGALNANVDNVIDPSLFRDTDGKNYLIWGSWHGVYYVELDTNCTSLASGTTMRQLVSTGTVNKGDWTNIEAPMVVKRDGYYYLIASKGTTVNQSTANDITYQLVMARSSSLGGQFNKVGGNNAFGTGGSMSNFLEKNEYVLGPGHCSQIVTDKNGVDWIFYHGYSKKSDGNWDYPGARKLFADKIVWNGWSEGWPGIEPYDGRNITMPSMDPLGPTTIEISTAQDLCDFAALVNGGDVFACATLINDIDMDGVSYTPIGTEEHKFKGVIEGQGFRIKNLLATGDNNVALVGVVDGGAEFKNIIIDSSCSFSGNNQVAGFVGHAKGSGTINFVNCGNEATITATGANASGFLGYTSGISTYWTNCYNTGYIEGGRESAAFSGWCGDKLTNCWNTGRTMGNDGNGNGKWLSLTRGTITQGYENTYDLNAANNSVTGMPDGYDPSWLENGHLAFVMNKFAKKIVWYQNVDNEFALNVNLDTIPLPFASHHIVYNNADVYYNYENGDVPESEQVFTRDNLTVGGFYTICLPYASENYSGATFYKAAGIEKEGDATTALVLESLEDDEPLQAGKPYVYCATDNTLTVNYTGSPVSSKVGRAHGLVGNLTSEKFAVPTGKYFLYNTNSIVETTSTVKANVGQYKAYFDLSKVSEYDENSASRNAVVFSVHGTVTTGIKDVNTNKADNSTYNVLGQRVANNAKGLVIKNGKKYIIK